MTAPAASLSAPRLATAGWRPGFLAPIVVGAAVSAVCAAIVSPWPVGVFLDDGIYVILAKSLATGEGYRYLNIPGAPSATHYPPGYPLLLAALWKLSPSFPENTALFKFANAALMGVAAAGAFVFLRSRLRFSTAVAAAVAIVVPLTMPVVILAG